MVQYPVEVIIVNAQENITDVSRNDYPQSLPGKLLLGRRVNSKPNILISGLYENPG